MNYTKKTKAELINIINDQNDLIKLLNADNLKYNTLSKQQTEKIDNLNTEIENLNNKINTINYAYKITMEDFDKLQDQNLKLKTDNDKLLKENKDLSDKKLTYKWWAIVITIVMIFDYIVRFIICFA